MRSKWNQLTFSTKKIHINSNGLSGETFFYHKYIIYTDKFGTKSYARGGPTNSGLNSGNIKTEHGEYTDSTPDWDRESNDPKENITSVPDLSGAWDKIKKEMNDINTKNIPYDPTTDNSNRSVDKAIKDAGLPDPKKDGWSDYWSPGSGNPFGTPRDWSIGDPFNGFPWPGSSPACSCTRLTNSPISYGWK